jgi:pimeloyl-ACP methyl ester carboxylesterase
MIPVPEHKIHAVFAAVLFCVLLLPLGNSLSQINKLDDKNLEETMRNPWKPDRSVFLQEWLVLGSIPSTGIGDLDKDFLIEYGGEGNARATEGQSLTLSGTELRWVPAKCDHSVDLAGIFRGGRTEDAVAYAYTTINRKEAGKVYFTVGSDDGIKIWLNGKLVHRAAILRGLTLDEDGFSADMNAGENRLVLKIQQGKGAWGFAVRMFENPNDLNIITGTITFSLVQSDPQSNSIIINSESNLDQTLLKQAVHVEAYTTGGKTVAKKTFNCGESVVLSSKDWPKGVYEFRCTYKDVRGVSFFKYLSWYKGDILAAARELVNSAPAGSARSPQASTHRMLADMILDRLGTNLQNPDSSKLTSLHSPLMEFADIKANKQVRPGGFVRLAYIDDIDNTPQFCRSYLPLQYDPSKKWPVIVYLHGYNGANPEYYNWWSADKRHDGVTDRHGVIFIEPHGRGNTQYRGIGDRDVLKCIELAKQKFNVDEDRVYLAGSSMGGFGTWNVATRHPELFAAIAPIYGGGDYHVNIPKEAVAKMSAWNEYVNDKSGSSAQLESLLDMPILVSHGDKDLSVDVNLSRYLVRMLQRWDYDVRYIEVPGKGHEELGLWDQTVPWMLQHKRDSAPRQVRVRAADLRTASAYWIEVVQRTDPREFMIVDAEVLQGNIIRVDSKNVCELSLTPSGRLIDYSKPIRIIWNGERLAPRKLSTEKIVLRAENYKPQPLRKTAQISGPISDVQNTPFLVVIGTTSSDSIMRQAIERKAATILGSWKAAQKYEPRSKKDVDVTEADMTKYSLMLLGGPRENTVTKRIFERIPFKVEDSTIVIAGKTFKAKDAVLHAVYPNPYNKERYVSIVAATSGAGFTFFDPGRADLFEFDYYIADGKIPVFSIGARSEKIMIASGFFNRDWSIDDAFLTAGDENLRSKCAYTVVNGDLSTKIISTIQPSAEILNSFVGTYQITGGPEVRVFLANGGLRAAQGPNDQFSAQLLPTAENEFYLKEINVSVAFRKSEPANRVVMVVYQNGMEFTSTRVR